MDNNLITDLRTKFENFVHQDEEVEFWYARELQTLLGYETWRNFEKIIEKAKITCEGSQQVILDHFADVDKMVKLGSGAKREVKDLKLTRYACYLIAQNGNPKKDEIAFAQTYFAIQTRKQEVLEQRLIEFERVRARKKLTESEKELSGLLYERGVDNRGFARIRSQGDSALFGGKSTQDMKRKLKVSDKRALADFLPAVTIKAKDLANEITNHNVKKNTAMKGETVISKEHVQNNQNMREMLKKSDIIPENLAPEEDLQKIQRRLKSEGKKISKSSKKLKS